LKSVLHRGLMVVGQYSSFSPVSSPQRPKLPAPQLPTVISPRQQQQESPPPRVESPPVESQPAITGGRGALVFFKNSFFSSESDFTGFGI
jgi:hypothetical protein